MIPSYEDFAWRKPLPVEPDLCPALTEAYRAADMVSWWGMINRQIESMLNQAVDAGDDESIQYLRKIHTAWNDNPIDENMNIEDLKLLQSAVEWPGRFKWKHKEYFSVLSDQVRRVLTTQSEMPTIPMEAPKTPKPGAGGRPPISPSKEPAATAAFGAEEQPGGREAPVEQQVENPEDIADDVRAMVNATNNK